MNNSSTLALLFMVMLGLVLGLFPQGALLLSPDTAALSSLAEQLRVDPAGEACSWDGITCEASRVVGMYAPFLKVTPQNCMLCKNFHHSSCIMSQYTVSQQH